MDRIALAAPSHMPRDDGGHLRGAPELVVEVLSPGAKNARRDRSVKLRLYARTGVDEYWLIDWRRRRVEVYRRSGDRLPLAQTLTEADVLAWPLLPGVALPVARAFDW